MCLLPDGMSGHFWPSLRDWWWSHARQYPWRQAGVSAYEVLLAEVLLKRTTATAAARVFPLVGSEYPTPASLALADASEVEALLEPVGLHRQRARSLKEIGICLVQEHGGCVPDTLEALERVPHLGPYSSRAILSFGCGLPYAVVDSNVVRVIGRVSGREQAQVKVRAVQAAVDLLLPKTEHREFNWAMLDLGALVCRYVRPRCSECPIRVLCQSEEFAHAAVASPGKVLRT